MAVFIDLSGGFKISVDGMVSGGEWYEENRITANGGNPVPNKSTLKDSCPNLIAIHEV